MNQYMEVNYNTDTKLQIPNSTSYNEIVSNYHQALQVIDDMVLKKYIGNLSDLPIVPLSDSEIRDNLKDNVLFFKITEMVYEKEEFAIYKFASVFNSLVSTESSVFLILDSNGQKTDFYMGVRALDPNRTTSSLRDTLRNSMKGQFPGIKTKDYTIDEMERIVDSFETNSISAVSCIANSKLHTINNQNFLQGLEKLVFSMQGEAYTGIIIANGTNQDQLWELRKGYETIYTQLSSLATIQMNYSDNRSDSLSSTYTESTSHSKMNNQTQSNSYGNSQSNSTNHSHSISQASVAGKTINGIACATSIIGSALAPLTGGASLAIGGIASGALGMLGAAISSSTTDSTSSGKTNTTNFSQTFGSSSGTTDTTSTSTAKTNGSSHGSSHGLTLTLHDKSMETILQRIDKQLKRIDEFESLGMYSCAAYFMSGNQYAAEVAASTYKSIMHGENSGIETSAINSWGNKQKLNTKLISQYVKNFIHPVFQYQGIAGNIEVTACSMVSGNELAIHMGLPRYSVSGLPVLQHTHFGKEVITYDNEEISSKINLGKIFHLGNSQHTDVTLDVNSLCMHTFITGSTGSGKSNAIYEIIRQLDNLDIGYMIIEPTKGEYKNIFGSQSDVTVLGTNPTYTQLLRINPFRFPSGVHVLEHVDKLVEIFQVCWPMYAAMPSVLKDALLQTYKTCGWNLETSVNTQSNELFPTFHDLLTELIHVIEDSAYSSEVKSNYMGALVTRVKSLTNGLNGQIFSAYEVDNSVLFDQKVIVDLSRIGSLETKSLIMGILVMRLNEHRMVYRQSMNEQLKHITVLEEAHNILKRTNTEYNNDSSNVTGKSVEMLSNAIAEMRTYGEGFIIVDQSAMTVDQSAIRNTNTKIILRLPDEQDRRICGKSAALNNEQLDEISRLPKGVAVVYQNNWVEPVLCKINRYLGEEKQYEPFEIIQEEDLTALFKTKMLHLLLNDRVKQPKTESVESVLETLNYANIGIQQKNILRQLLNQYIQTNELHLLEENHFDELSQVVSQLLDNHLKTRAIIESSNSFDALTDSLMKFVQEETVHLSPEFALATAQCLIKNESLKDQESFNIYASWITHLQNKGWF